MENKNYKADLSVYLREMKICVHTKTYIGIFVAALFIIDKTGNNSDVL